MTINELGRILNPLSNQSVCELNQNMAYFFDSIYH